MTDDPRIMGAAPNEEGAAEAAAPDEQAAEQRNADMEGPADDIAAALEASLAVAADLDAERAALERHWHQRRERARYEVDRARRQYGAVEPENRLVARTLTAPAYRSYALAGGPPLDDVGAEVVGLHEPRQRPTLAQRGDVAGGGDGGQHSARQPSR